MSADSLACKVCRALIDCPRQEVDDYVAAIGEHLYKNASAISALDLCYPCLQNVRPRPQQQTVSIKFEPPKFNTYITPV